MQTRFGKFKALIIVAPIALLASSLTASASDNVQNGYFSVPAATAKQGWPYTAPAQLFPQSTTSDTTNPFNPFNPASVANSGVNPNYLSTPLLGGNPYAGGFTPNTGFGTSTLGSFHTRSIIPYLGLATSHIPYVGSFGVPFLGGGFGGWGGWGGISRGWGGYSSWGNPFNYGGYGLGGLGLGGFGLGGFGYGGNPAAWMGSAHQGTVPNRIIQTGPSPSSGNYYQPATADPSASGGYYASGSPSTTTIASPPVKHQPKTYYGTPETDNWGGGGNPFPKDLNSVPWSR